MSRRELPAKLFAPIDQRHRGLMPERRATCEPLDFVRLQIPVAEVLSILEAADMSNLIDQGLLLHLDGFELGHVQLPDFGAGAAEELAQQLVAGIRTVVGRGDELAKLQLDHVINLLLGICLHL